MTKTDIILVTSLFINVIYLTFTPITYNTLKHLGERRQPECPIQPIQVVKECDTKCCPALLE